MELDDLKTEWQNTNATLDSNLMVNQEILNKRNLGGFKNEMTKPLIHEIMNIIVVSLTVIATLIGSFIYINELKFSLPGFIGVVIGSIYIYLATRKTIRISKIKYLNTSIIEVQKEISTLSLLILKFRKLELMMFPFFIISILPITFITIQNRDLYNDLHFFLFELTFIIGFGFLGIFWINKNLYDKKIMLIKLFLNELADEME